MNGKIRYSNNQCRIDYAFGITYQSAEYDYSEFFFEFKQNHSVDITPQELAAAMTGLEKGLAERYTPILNSAFKEFQINTVEKRNMFLAQIGHESNNLKALAKSENLNYSSADRIQKVFGKKRFPTVDSAIPYVKNPTALANYVYSGRMGNKDEESGDGFKYRGRGAIQITGKSNYEALSKDATFKGVDFVKNPELLQQPEYAIRASAWWWKTHGLNENLDKYHDIKRITRIINGGYNGLDDRIERLKKINEVLKP
jgi:putative chitinase